MIDWIWKGVAAIAGLAALVFGVNAANAKRRMDRDKANREAAQQKLVEDACRNLEEARKKYAGQAPIHPSKRTDFE